MDSDNTQQELFDDFQDGKRPFKRPRGLLARPTYVSVPIERLIFIGIGVVMALVMAHAVGVERGKTMARDESKRLGAERPIQMKARQYTVCVGRFTSLEEAAKVEKGLKTKYKDCVVRKLQ